ncbi:putative casein kinase II subunit alpha like protein [Astathelohania contejeani]|uniref:Casein kinase II subunit alpha n=1 Tax=Astathelohania contejeani TaxID=164912 RepID=A0ABQ7I194_9MICR|nr:putative casein kinase II subunit alpha like protein [Thelohania contejeani]
MTKPTEAREYANINTNKPESEYNYDKYNIEEGDIDDYEITKRIGQGKYSEVFLGKKIDPSNSKCVIKVLKPVRLSKVKREIMILRKLDHPGIVDLWDVVRDPDSGAYILIFEYFEAYRDTRSLFKLFEMQDIRFLMKQILTALDYAHGNGIIHRDIKPQNIIINPVSKQLKVIDWGLAEFYHPKTEYNVKVASRYYKAPELLVNYRYYDYSLDIWSLGCLFAETLFKTCPFFCGDDNEDQLVKIVNVLGYEDFENYLHEYEIEIPKKLRMIVKKCNKIEFTTFIENPLEEEKYEKAINLLENMLVFDHQKRLTAKECLHHPFFKE